MLDENAKKQRDFFNRLSPSWREEGYDPQEIKDLLSPISFKEGERVLDVACGSGVLDAVLLSFGVKVDGLDVSDKMIEKAKSDPKNAGVDYIVGDFYRYEKSYDKIIVFDAYPHFTDKNAFRISAARNLERNGELWIFRDEGREKIDARHEGMGDLSVGLKTPEEESIPLSADFSVIYAYSDEKRYYLGLKRR